LSEELERWKRQYKIVEQNRDGLAEMNQKLERENAELKEKLSLAIKGQDSMINLNGKLTEERDELKAKIKEMMNIEMALSVDYEYKIDELNKKIKELSED